MPKSRHVDKFRRALSSKASPDMRISYFNKDTPSDLSKEGEDMQHSASVPNDSLIIAPLPSLPLLYPNSSQEGTEAATNPFAYCAACR